ncbi:MAG: extracellular solute-binding protein [Massilia sp.]|jgi:multiple sugar transport system substrate-binding protein|nr:extracellular solute-binding protein [Massilia sp.]
MKGALALLTCVPLLCQAAPVEVTVWRHDTGDAEMDAGRAAVARFNLEQGRWKVVVEAIPQGSYNALITAASLVGHLPCVIALDQPAVANFAWAGHIQPLDGLLPPDSIKRLLVGGRGAAMGKTYSVGQFDVVLALFARRSELAALGVRIASIQHPYTAAEFRDILVKAKQSGRYRFPLDLNGRTKGEWPSYAYGPWLQSGGADLVERANPNHVDGILNSKQAVAVGDYIGGLFRDKLAERNPADDQAFTQGRALFHYTGSWSARAYLQRFGDDLLVLPPPDFGIGPKVGAGSWQWAITRSCPTPLGAAAFIAHLISTREMTTMVNATGYVPMSAQSAAASDHYRTGGKWRIFYDFAERYAVPRPATPAYPIISTAFEKAILDIRSGKDAEEALDEAVEAIDGNLRRNGGYADSSGLKGKAK